MSPGHCAAAVFVVGDGSLGGMGCRSFSDQEWPTLCPQGQPAVEMTSKGKCHVHQGPLPLGSAHHVPTCGHSY